MANKQEAQNKGQNKGRNRKPRREQPRKDSSSKRVNFDNERVDKFEKSEIDKTAKCNDVRWYAQNPELLRSAASLPFSTTAGQPLTKAYSTAVPGVAAIHWIPAIGGSNGDPINQAKDNIYSFTVHANSRNQSYDAADEMMMIIAGANVFAGIGAGIRAYGLARQYAQENKYYPDALIQACGFDPQDLKANLANMWFGLNELISRATQIWIPDVMPVIERWFWLNANIYKDGESIKAQTYVFAQQGYYQLSETGDPNGTSLAWKSWESNTTWAEYLTFMNDLIQPLIDSQDRGIIFGDILKAYGADKLYKIPVIDTNYAVTPVYDQEVLTQIENLCCATMAGGKITQDPDTGRIIQTWTPISNFNVRNMFPKEQILNFHIAGTPTPEDIMVATRLKPIGTTVLSVNAGTPTQYAPTTYGTEVPTLVTYYGYSGTTLQARGLGSFVATTNGGINAVNMQDWAAFDWAPWVYAGNPPTPSGVAAGDEVGYTLGQVLPIGDFEQYTIVNVSELDKMHTCAIYSEFGLPSSI